MLNIDIFAENIETSEIVEPETFGAKREKLQMVGLLLKKDFVGLDTIIDRLITTVEAWYLMPDSMSRPAIVCLWGMTGVGKTDLVRKFVKYLGYSSRFLEIQMSNTGSTGTYSGGSIQSKIGYSNLEPNTPGILFLDEFQRYRTRNEKGGAINNIKGQDVWQLLSDGKFATIIKQTQILNLLYGDLMYDYGATRYMMDEDEDFISNDNDDEERRPRKKPRRKSIYNRGYHSASELKKLLSLKESIPEIMRWTDEQKKEVVRTVAQKPELFDGDDYSQLLIIISGNIDEAYRMADSVSNTDIDADILHEFSKRINFLTIKNALKMRFYPEQIARFGNNHVVYPSLNKASFRELIERRVSEVFVNIQKSHNVSMTCGQSVIDTLYRNGVFPVQGVRPIFSTIYAIIETGMPKAILYSVDNGVNSFHLECEKNMLNFIDTDTGEVVLSSEFFADVDEIKDETDPRQKMLAAVHEGGHAIVYAALMGVAPTQIEGNPASAFEGGFVGLHKFSHSRKTLSDLIAVAYGGQVAEMLVFKDLSTGGVSDLGMATKYASKMVNLYGMGDKPMIFAAPNVTQEQTAYVNPESKRDMDKVVPILMNNYERAKVIVENNSKLLIAIAKELMENDSISPDDFVALCAEHDLEIKVWPAKQVLSTDSISAFENFEASISY